jgi:DNA-binding NarL/FixJ family response regulator
MSSWGVQVVIGRLITDAEFLQRFQARALDLLITVCQQGIELSDREVAAIVEMDPRWWAAMASQLDPRLRAAGSAHDARPRAATPPRSLTVRERHVLRGIFEGRTNKQIAVDVGTSEAAVKSTIQQLFRKTQVRTRAQLVRVVVEGSPVACVSGR